MPETVRREGADDHEIFSFGTTGVSVSELGFGAIPIIRLSFAEAERTLRRAYDLGITLFDTANAYHDSEEKIGRALSPVRDRIFLATKTMKRTPPPPRNTST